MRQIQFEDTITSGQQWPTTPRRYWFIHKCINVESRADTRPIIHLDYLPCQIWLF